MNEIVRLEFASFVDYDFSQGQKVTKGSCNKESFSMYRIVRFFICCQELNK